MVDAPDAAGLVPLVSGPLSFNARCAGAGLAAMNLAMVTTLQSTVRSRYWAPRNLRPTDSITSCTLNEDWPLWLVGACKPDLLDNSAPLPSHSSGS